MRISSRFSSAWLAPALFALTWGLGASQGQTFSGNWRLNLEKTRWTAGSRPGSVLVVVYQQGSDIQYHGAAIYSGEEMRVFGFAGAFDGKPYRMSRSFGDGMITLRRLDENTFESTFHSDDGVFTETAKTWVSADGKTLTRKLTLRGRDGTQTWTEIYDKK